MRLFFDLTRAVELCLHSTPNLLQGQSFAVRELGIGGLELCRVNPFAKIEVKRKIPLGKSVGRINSTNRNDTIIQ